MPPCARRFQDYYSEQAEEERASAERLARAAAWEREKQEAQANKVSGWPCFSEGSAVEWMCVRAAPTAGGGRVAAVLLLDLCAARFGSKVPWLRPL